MEVNRGAGECVVSTDMNTDKHYHAELMDEAIRLSEENVAQGGGPFGAVIARGAEIIATGVNSVTRANDPTAHAEVSAIRNACTSLGTFKLPGCTVYSSCEPCPMCLSALYWAGVSRIYYGNTKEDAAAIDFSDKFIYDELALAPSGRHIPQIHMENTGAIRAFEQWASKPDKTPY